MNTFKEGQTVESKLKRDKLGTVVTVADDMLVVRWDGESSGVYVLPSRVKVVKVNPKTHVSFFDKDTSEFKRGDYIEVDSKAFGLVRGTALTEFTAFGYADYQLLADDGNYYQLNSNRDRFTVLFRADIARGDDPDY